MPDIAQLGPLLELPLNQYPDLGLSASAKLFRRNGELRLSGVDGMISGEGIRFGRFQARYQISTYPASGSVNVDLAVDNLGVFTQPLGLQNDQNPSDKAVGECRRELGAIHRWSLSSRVSVMMPKLHINAKVNPFEKKRSLCWMPGLRPKRSQTSIKYSARRFP